MASLEVNAGPPAKVGWERFQLMTITLPKHAQRNDEPPKILWIAMFGQRRALATREGAFYSSEIRLPAEHAERRRLFPPHSMNNITINLVVLRSPNVERAVAFYSRLGLQFSQHRHGSGPEHFTASLPGGVFELYPLAADGASSLGTRIGFQVPSVDAALAALSDYPAAVVTPASDSEWGRRAVVADPDGHRVELTEA